MSIDHEIKLTEGITPMYKFIEGVCYDWIVLARVPIGREDPNFFADEYIRSFVDTAYGRWCLKNVKEIEYKFKPGATSLFDFELFGYIKPVKLTEMRIRFTQ
jgi:hypothetical protein